MPTPIMMWAGVEDDSGTSIRKRCSTIFADGVTWFAADGDYVVAHTKTSTHLVHLPLARLESRLDPKRFLRIHRAHIINLDCLRKFRRGVRGELVAEMMDDTRLPVSRARALELRHLAV